jgi:DNA-binding response OmpR family regulator
LDAGPGDTLGSVTQLLLVDSDRTYATDLARNLEVSGYEVRVAANAPSALWLAERSAPALALVELDLAGDSGYTVLQRMRLVAADTPVFVLTTRRHEVDVLRAFQLGADDYIRKPIGLRVLLARIRAVLRRVHVGENAGPSWIRVGALDIHPETRRARRAGMPVMLTHTEYDLLLTLLRHRGQPVSRGALFRAVWRQPPPANLRTIDTHMFTLRRKLEVDPRHPRHLLAAYGRGYVIAEPSPHDDRAHA